MARRSLRPGAIPTHAVPVVSASGEPQELARDRPNILLFEDVVGAAVRAPHFDHLLKSACQVLPVRHFDIWHEVIALVLGPDKGGGDLCGERLRYSVSVFPGGADIRLTVRRQRKWDSFRS